MELLFVRRLKRKERDELYYLLEDKRFKDKVLIILLSHEGCEVREIARRLNIHPETARRWIRKFNDLGLNCFFKKPGRKRKLTPRIEKKILSVAIKKPHKLKLSFSTWSLRKLEYYINKKLGIRVSHAQIGKILLKHGLKLRKAREELFSNDQEYETKKRRVEKLMKRPNSKVIFQDEKVMVAKEYLGYEWCFKARVVPRNQRIKGKTYVYWFYDWHNRKVYRKYFDELRKENFFKALEWMSKKVNDLIYIILDNSPVHPKPKIKKDMERVPWNIKLVFLPTYAPKLNRVEDINSMVQREVLNNRKFKSIIEVKKALDRWIRNFNRK